MKLQTSVPWSVTGKDDIQQLKFLASSVGREFAPNDETDARLKNLGIRNIRCINVDPVDGHFEADGKFKITGAAQLDANLGTCQRTGATPHIIMATGITDDLRLKETDLAPAEESLLGIVHATTFGPTDWAKYRIYCKAFFEYVMITKAFREARFEVGNETDAGGGIVPRPPKPQNGSAASYAAYLELYKNVAKAADEFQTEHPDLKLSLGGPAFTSAYTFRFGDFNWDDRFIRDCGLSKTRLDFISFHFYGNLASLHGEYPTLYPSFETILKTYQVARDAYTPGVPIWITEWGPSYQTVNSPVGAVNANHIGAAWDAEFLNTMLNEGVDGAIYLVTTDLTQASDGGKMENNWGWVSLFVDPNACGGTFPKAPAHVFDMISRMSGKRIAVSSSGSPAIHCIASADPAGRKITLMIWNYNAQIPESEPARELAKSEKVTLSFQGAAAFFDSKPVTVERWMVAEGVSDAYGQFQKHHKLDAATELQKISSSEFRSRVKSAPEVTFDAPPSSVSFVTLSGG